MTEEEPTPRERILTFMVEPMSMFWILIATILIAGIVLTVRNRAIAWEAFFSAATLSLLVQFLAQLRDVHAWPWSGRKRVTAKAASSSDTSVHTRLVHDLQEL